MKIVITLGGNALLRRGEALSADNQRRNIEVAAQALARLAAKHDLVLSHGNGPQVGLLALQNEAYARENPAVPAYPFDVLGAESQAMVGYMFAQALSRAKEAEREHGWVVRQDGKGYRRVIASPRPLRIVEFPIIKNLVDTGTLVISCGGGGVPVIKSEKGLQGVEAVIDKDFAGSILATELCADLLLIATDVDGVYENWGTPQQRRIERITPQKLLQMGFAAGSMGPKIEAACQFVLETGCPAAIGPLDRIEEVAEGKVGTWIVAEDT